MGAKDWILMYADGEIRPILQAAPPPDREATRQLVERLYPGHDLTPLGDRDLMDANPPDGHVHAACFPGLTIVCTSDVALDHPSRLGWRFRAEADGRAMYLHAMHSVVDWCAFAVWSADGGLRRSLSLSPRSGICEDIGEPLPFEGPYWAGERQEDDDEDTDPWRFHPLDLAEDALRHLFGFCYEGGVEGDDPDLEAVTLLAYEVRRRPEVRRPGVDVDEIAAHMHTAFPDTQVSRLGGEPSFDDHFFFERLAPDPDRPTTRAGLLWASLVTSDTYYDASDDPSDLDRPGVFRFSIRLTAGIIAGLELSGQADPAALDVLVPHPAPGRFHRGGGWVSVLCPDRTWPQVRELLAVAHDLAVQRVREP